MTIQKNATGAPALSVTAATAENLQLFSRAFPADKVLHQQDIEILAEKIVDYIESVYCDSIRGRRIQRVADMIRGVK